MFLLLNLLLDIEPDRFFKSYYTEQMLKIWDSRLVPGAIVYWKIERRRNTQQPRRCGEWRSLAHFVKLKMHMPACSVVTPWTIAHQAPLSLGFSRQEYCHGLPIPPPGDLPDPGIEPKSPASPAMAGGFFTTEPPGSPKLNMHRVPYIAVESFSECLLSACHAPSRHSQYSIESPRPRSLL